MELFGVYPFANLPGVFPVWWLEWGAGEKSAFLGCLGVKERSL